MVTAGWVYRFTAGFDPSMADDLRDWEIDPSTLEIGRKVGEGEFGTVHKVRIPRHQPPLLHSPRLLKISEYRIHIV